MELKLLTENINILLLQNKILPFSWETILTSSIVWTSIQGLGNFAMANEELTDFSFLFQYGRNGSALWSCALF